MLLRVLRLVALAPALVVALAACARDVWDIDIALAPHAYDADFGTSSSGTIPTIACDASMVSSCMTQQTLAASTTGGPPADVQIHAGCDVVTAKCYADVGARVAYELDVLQDDAFVTKVERKATTFVRVLDLGYTMPRNTLTFAVPRIDVFVGPPGTKTESDPGVVLVDSISTVAPREIFTEPRHLTVADGSAARALIEDSIQARRSFVFVVATVMRLDAGTPAPGGAFEIDLLPKIRVGLPP